MSVLQTDENGVGVLSRSVDFGRVTQYPVFSLLAAITFLFAALLVASYFTAPGSMSIYVVAAAVIGGYMAMNIGANDVANNVAAAVGSRALTLGGAIVIAAIFETAGALIAGGDVVSTISKGIIDPSFMGDSTIFILAMGSALLAGAVWLNLATWVGAPVSTTHSIVGGVLGGGIAAAGFGVVDWGVMSKIAASWFISPVLGGFIAAMFLAFVNRVIFSHTDMLASSRRWLPVLIGIMAGAFAMYLTMKGLKRIWKAEGWMIMAIGVATFTAAVVISRPILARASLTIENRRKDVNALFNIPLVCAAALLAFAHGANDVANAIGPLSAIASVASTGVVAAKVGIPLWIMLIGAVGIATGLALYGAKLIKTIGRQLTTLDQSRAFCIALSTAITVIAASALALPVSTTHITVGAVFGVGFYREFLAFTECRAREARFALAAGHGELQSRGLVNVAPRARYRRRKLFRRRQLVSILSAWIITVPGAAALSALIFFIARTTIVG
ncbi:Probable low-affinity inorganic phosphate transporter [hydrothermal vent metagenome]|uniref:Probable low-affinity inorganic phosphate transporter n=1 Tax=hydrothermal vent metagenome TaxID=652676 RepID=A0A3B0T5V7_9ZZZZ